MTHNPWDQHGIGFGRYVTAWNHTSRLHCLLKMANCDSNMEVDAPRLSAADIEELKATYSDPQIISSNHDLLMPHIFESLAGLLKDPGIRVLFKVPDTLKGGQIFWRQLNEEERNGLTACVNAAIQHGMWNDLIAHSTYFYPSRSHEYDPLSQAHFGQTQDFRISSERDGAANLARSTDRYS